MVEVSILDQVSISLGINVELFGLILGSAVFLGFSVALTNLMGRGLLAAMLTMFLTMCNVLLGIWPFSLALVNGFAIISLISLRTLRSE